MKVLSTVLSLAVLAEFSIMPAFAATPDATSLAPANIDSQPVDLGNGGCAPRKKMRRVHKTTSSGTYTTTTTSTSTSTNTTQTPVTVPQQTITQPAVVESCPSTVITQPAVVEGAVPVATACRAGINPLAYLAGAALLATAIAVPIAVGVHEHHEHTARNRARAAALQQQQLLLFRQQQIAAAEVAATPSFIPGFGFGTIVPGIGFVPAVPVPPAI